MDIDKPLTCLITMGKLTPENFEQQRNKLLATVKASVVAGISMIQIREKLITSEQLFELSRDCASAIVGSDTKLLVNGRPDIAAAAGAHGVHLPENGLPIAAVRKGFSLPFLIGASVHSLEAASSAKNSGADLVVFGPIFDSGEKKGKGLDELKAICNELEGFPVVAVGGIDESNSEHVMTTGAAGFAAIKYLNRLVSDNWRPV